MWIDIVLCCLKNAQFQQLGYIQQQAIKFVHFATRSLKGALVFSSGNFCRCKQLAKLGIVISKDTVLQSNSAIFW